MSKQAVARCQVLLPDRNSLLCLHQSPLYCRQHLLLLRLLRLLLMLLLLHLRHDAAGLLFSLSSIMQQQ